VHLPHLPRRPVHVTAFSRDNTTILSGSDDCTLRLHDLPTGAEIATFLAHSVCHPLPLHSPPLPHIHLFSNLLARMPYLLEVVRVGCLWARMALMPLLT